MIFRILMLNFCNTIFIHKFYCIDFYFSFFDHKSLIISRINNKKTLICYFNPYLSVGCSQNSKTEYNYVYVFIKYFCAIVPSCKTESNILFRPLNLNKASEKCTGYSKLFFATGAWLWNRCTFALDNGLDGRFIPCYWVRAE